MENRYVGFLVLGISLVLILIILLFQSALKDIVTASCNLDADHALNCPMEKSITQQTWLSLGIVGILLILGTVLIFTKPKEKIITKMVKEPKRKIDLSSFEPREKEIIKILQQENGTIFQASLMEKTNMGKVSLTRILDKLEAKQVIERKRRGMNNVVVFKN